MTLPPENDGAKPSLRFVYDNAMRGKEFHDLLESDRHRLTTATLAMAKAEVIGGLGTATVLTIALLTAVMLKIVDERAHPVVLNPIAVAAIIMTAALFVAKLAGDRAARVYRYKENADSIRKLERNHQDLDGVKRTPEERRFLVSPFGVAMRALVRVEGKLDAAESLNAPEPVRAAALQGVSRARGELKAAMEELEVIWQTRSGVDAAIMIDALAPQQRAEAILAAAMPHMTTLVLAYVNGGASDV